MNRSFSQFRRKKRTMYAIDIAPIAKRMIDELGHNVMLQLDPLSTPPESRLAMPNLKAA